ncbi:MAG: hypothetical protein K6F50_02820 [Kiritimatiellae bacterium]|nr:hypothetical protein [Kiritimatiellia bacterium]
MKKTVHAVSLSAVLLLAGCASYSWRPSVPAESRTVAVPVFRNATDVSALGSVVTSQVLREFQREGTYVIASPGDAALEVQGELVSSSSPSVAYERRTGARTREHRFRAKAVVSFIDKRSGKVLVDKRKYTAETTFLANDDILTGERDASGRIAEDIARQIVDDATSLAW